MQITEPLHYTNALVIMRLWEEASNFKIDPSSKTGTKLFFIQIPALPAYNESNHSQSTKHTRKISAKKHKKLYNQHPLKSSLHPDWCQWCTSLANSHRTARIGD